MANLNQFFQSGTELDYAVGQQLVITMRLFGSANSFQDLSLTREVFTPDGSNSYQVIAITERHSVIGSTTLMLVKAAGSTPLGSGLNVLQSTLDLTAAVDVVRLGTLYASTGLTQIVPGDALGLRATNLGNLPPVGIVSIQLQRI
jgi:hypothetical protein